MGDIADYNLDTMEYAWEFDDESHPHKLDRGPGKCPKCKGATVLRKGKYGEFYGCVIFPKCNGSRCFI